MSFSLDLSNAIENIKENRDKIVRGTLIQLSNNVIKRTPVGNPKYWAPSSLPAPEGYVGGTLRGAWNASFNAPDQSKHGTIEKSPNGGQTAVKAATKINSLQMGQTFYLTNPQPYARRVEYGHSKQRPAGMLRVSIAEAQRVFDSQ